jgi:hypothetical protein
MDNRFFVGKLKIIAGQILQENLLTLAKNRRIGSEYFELCFYFKWV